MAPGPYPVRRPRHRGGALAAPSGSEPAHDHDIVSLLSLLIKLILVFISNLPHVSERLINEFFMITWLDG